MAKFQHSVRIRIGASHDDVTISQSNGDTLFFDRAALGYQRIEGATAQLRMDAKTALYSLRKEIVDSFVKIQEQKHKRSMRRQRKGYAVA